MSNRLIIAYSGKKQAGKSSAAKYTLCEFLNRKVGQSRFDIEKMGKVINIVDRYNNNKNIEVDYPNPESEAIFDAYSVKVYSFADPLKRFCIDVLGLDQEQCYGSDDDKNSFTHISWDSMPTEVREVYSRPRRGSGGVKPASGDMTAREVMQVFGTDICRKIDTNCWARGLYNIIEDEGYELAIITDARFPNEVTLGTETGAKVVRLLRKVNNDKHPSEVALDNFPLGEFSLVIDNQRLTIPETHNKLKLSLTKWFDSVNI
jgi:hypothetical protein